MANNEEEKAPEEPGELNEEEREALLDWLLDPDTSVAEMVYDFD